MAKLCELGGGMDPVSYLLGLCIGIDLLVDGFSQGLLDLVHSFFQGGMVLIAYGNGQSILGKKLCKARTHGAKADDTYIDCLVFHLLLSWHVILDEAKQMKQELKWLAYLVGGLQLLPLIAITGYFHLRILVARCSDPSGNSEYRLAKRFAQVVLHWLGYRVELHQEVALPTQCPYAVVSNHASYLDFAVLLGFFPTPLRFIAKRELTRLPAIGSYLKKRGILINRKERASAILAIEQGVKVHQDIPILIFPEGTRSNDGKLKPFKRGGLGALIQQGLDLVPVAIMDTNRYLPRGSVRFYGAPAVIRMWVGKPLKRSGFATSEAMIEALEKLIADKLGQDL